MQLHEVFAASDDAPPPIRPVTFRALSPTKNGPPRDVKAAIAIVDELETSAAVRDAEIAIALEYAGDKGSGPIPIPPGVRGSEQIYHLLLRALRDPVDPRKPLARTILELKKALMPDVATRLHQSYREFIEGEFPVNFGEEAIDDATGK